MKHWLPLLLVVATADAAPMPEKVRYNEHIRPILSGTCFYCHGPDEKHREAKLRLDERESAVTERDGVRAIVPGKPDESDLIARVLSHDKDDMMPPPKAKKPALTPEQIALIRKWIEQGAEYEGHWAFLPLSKAAPPDAKNKAWVKNPIDQYILARLEREGMKPSAEADPATLCRRMFLDLTGLLPTPEETRDFVQAATRNRDAAVAQLADKLLASPHYGERWGRHWLDQARYADSNGYTIDNERTMWPYRDWVISALNSDMPFDRFTTEQLAGDLLPGATKSQLVATAFHRNTLINEEGGTKPEQFRVEAVIDRVNTTGAVWLGLTVGCAQCHTHKFDPIPHREYYEMLAFFNSGEDVNNKGATVSVIRGEMFGKAIVPPAVTQLDPEEQSKRQIEWEKTELARLGKAQGGPAKWMPVQYAEYDTTAGASFRLLPDNSLLSDGGASFNDTYRVVAKTTLKRVAAVRLRVLTDDSLPKKGPGLAGNGNFVLTDFKVTIGSEDVSIASAYADHEQPEYPVSAAFDEKPQSGWAINVGKGQKDVKMNAEHEAVFVFSKPVEVSGRSLEFQLHHDLNQNYLIGRFALEFAENVPSKPDDSLSTALRTTSEERTEAQRKLLRDSWERAETASRKKKFEEGNTADVMVMKETLSPRQTFLFQRGDFLRPDEKLGALQPGVFKVVAPALAPAKTRTRLDLARWLVNPENPLTPRVTMNRVWMRYFGRGIVETDEDFGAQGSAPTHPELLDWLGGELMRRGWSMKAMHKLIVTSATYRQSSNARPDLAEKDPRNVLLARQERVRFEAEIVRDAALTASGLLDRTIGGPSVRPPQPDGVYSFTQNAKKWVAETGPNRFRRTLYTQFFRSAPYPLFTTFDAPDFQTTCTRRLRSNTPLQALTVANDAVFVELAQGLAARALHEAPGEDATAQIRRAFALCLSREPSGKELSLLSAYFKSQRDAFANDEAGAKALLSPDLAKSGASAADAAALVCVARAIFNTDNFITRE